MLNQLSINNRYFYAYSFYQILFLFECINYIAIFYLSNIYPFFKLLVFKINPFKLKCSKKYC